MEAKNQLKKIRKEVKINILCYHNVGSNLSLMSNNLIRFLILTGNWRENEFANIFADRPPPPTSRYYKDRYMIK